MNVLKCLIELKELIDKIKKIKKLIDENGSFTHIIIIKLK